MTSAPAPVPREIVLACSAAGIAVIHVFGSDGKAIESVAGSREILLEYCRDRFPHLTPKEITTLPASARS